MLLHCLTGVMINKCSYIAGAVSLLNLSFLLVSFCYYEIIKTYMNDDYLQLIVLQLMRRLIHGLHSICGKSIHSFSAQAGLLRPGPNGRGVQAAVGRTTNLTRRHNLFTFRFAVSCDKTLKPAVNIHKTSGVRVIGPCEPDLRIPHYIRFDICIFL